MAIFEGANATPVALECGQYYDDGTKAIAFLGGRVYVF
jgi:hypothetical protein